MVIPPTVISMHVKKLGVGITSMQPLHTGVLLRHRALKKSEAKVLHFEEPP
jgi:hypothetical protein